MRALPKSALVVSMFCLLSSLLPVLASANVYFPVEAGLNFPYARFLGGDTANYITITGPEDFHGHSAWAFRNDEVGNSDGPVFEFYSVAADGDVLYHGRRSTGASAQIIEIVADPPYRILDMPASQGGTWLDTYTRRVWVDGVESSASPGYTYGGQIIAVDSDVTVPAGDFAAIQVECIRTIPGQTQNEDYWFAEDMGIVRWDEYFSGSPGVSSYLLWDSPVDVEPSTWGSLKALYR